jgi:hypothetical protein
MYERDWQARFVYEERNDVRLEDYACNDRHRDLCSVKGLRELPMTIGLPRTRHALASVVVLGALVGPAAFLSVLAAEAPRTGAPPGLDLSAPGVAWAGFVAPKEPNYTVARLFNDFARPATGLGPVTDGPDHPYANNEVARERGGKNECRALVT